jgi:hypothetical protein
MRFARRCSLSSSVITVRLLRAHTQHMRSTRTRVGMDPKRAVADLLVSSNNEDEAAWVCSLSADDMRFTLTFKDDDQKIRFWKKAYGTYPCSSMVDSVGQLPT